MSNPLPPLQLTSTQKAGVVVPFSWDIQAERAAMLVAEGEQTYKAIAAELGIAYDTLKQWRRSPEFKERVQSIIDLTKETYLQTGILHKQERIGALQEVYQRLKQIVEERAADLRYADEPGWTSGLLVHKTKTAGSGKTAVTVDEFATDTALVTSLTSVLKQVAQEQGQWVEKSETDHTITKIEVVYEDMKPEDL